MNRQEKTTVIEDIVDKLAQTKFAVISDYRGLKVHELQDLRKGLRQSEAELKVVKNSLLGRAANGTSFAPLSKYLEGTTVVALSYGDPVAPAKILSKFADDHLAFTIKGGILQGKEISAEGIKSLSKLPSREVLIAQMLTVMIAVPTSMVMLLSAVPRKLLYGLNAIQGKKNNVD